MIDRISEERRSWNMSRIRGVDTNPEKRMRSLLHRAGFRFRLHDKNLPGRPDIILKKYRAVIFVHGCFWHRHEGCPDAAMPQSRTEFWRMKFADTVKRDRKNIAALESAGWKPIIVWECELKSDPQGVIFEVRKKLRGISP